eukprot:scaffold10388_cov115-Skeletonema_marinoi.AAC.4
MGHKIVASEATVASSSSHTPIKSSPEKIQHKRKRRRRRRIENDVLSIVKEDDPSLMQPSVIVEKACNITKQESVAASSSPTLTQLPSQEKIEHKRKRKSRRRRKGNDNNLAKDDLSLSSLPSNRTKSTSHSTTTLESNHKLVQTTEELENNLHISNDGNNNTSTAAIVTNETVVTYDKDECEAVKTDILLSAAKPAQPAEHPQAEDDYQGDGTQSQSNATNKVTVQESVSSVKATDRKLNAAKNKKKKATIKKANTSKSTTTSSTGKEGECLRRIKHEWKNANLLRWHFSVAGPANSVYENGIYHGRVLLPKDYPASPPRVQMITPSGRFIPGHDICLSASSYHPETWTPRWTVLSLVDGLRLHMLTTANEIGGVLASDEKRRQYAIESRSWKYHGIANHERMVAENIFALRSLSSGGDDGGNDCEKEVNSDKFNIVNSAIASDEVTDEVTTGEDLKCEKNKDVISIEDAVKGCPEHDKDASNRSSVKRKKSKSKKNKTSEDLIGEEHSNVVAPAEDAIISVTTLEKDASKPASTSMKATKRKKKSRVTSAVETGENATQQDIHAKDEAPKKKKKKNRKKKSTVTSAVETVDDLTHGQSSNKSTSTKKKKKKKSRKKSTDVQVEAEEQSITTVLLKRLLVEMLKLPLRVLAILIRILDRLENYMRAILDGI